jgi:hypothetical protein
VFWLTRQPAARSAEVIHGAPSFPFRAANLAATSASSRCLRSADGGSTPGFHLQNHDCDTPSARQDTACGTS